MTLFVFITVVQAIIAALLVTVILMQKSEGGGLGTGGNPSGFMSARGAADFMTRATSILACAFVGLSVVLGVLAVRTTATRTIDTAHIPVVPTSAPVDPQAGALPVPTASTSPAPAAAPAKPDPLSGAAKQ
jgi:preprotein translocase subunit SecG